jgi:hypothetical protein
MTYLAVGVQDAVLGASLVLQDLAGRACPGCATGRATHMLVFNDAF